MHRTGSVALVRGHEYLILSHRESDHGQRWPPVWPVVVRSSICGFLGMYFFDFFSGRDVEAHYGFLWDFLFLLGGNYTQG